MSISSEKIQQFQTSTSTAYTKKEGLTSVTTTQYYKKNENISEHDPIFEVPIKSTS
jgi:hypothetical protein